LLRTRFDESIAVPGQILLLEVTILVPTWMSKPPQFPGFDLADVSVRLPEGSSRPAMERIEGETWSGVSRVYQISPLVVGKFRLPPHDVVITYADPETRAPIVVTLQTGEFVFEGRAPAGAEDLDPFIAAQTLSLEETIEGDPKNLEPGDAFTRVVSARLTGASPFFLPPLIAPFRADGLAAYPKEPSFTESGDRDRDGTSGARTESVTYVAEAGGRFTVEPVRLRWWNLTTKEIEVSELPALEIISRGPPPVAISPPLEPRDWLRAFIAGGLIIVVGVGSGRWLWPRYARWRARRRALRLASEAFAFDQVVRAMKARSFGEALRAIEAWSRRAPTIPGEDHDRVFGSLERLGAQIYGRDGRTPSKREWSEALAALRRQRSQWLAEGRRRRARQGLPSLNPNPPRVPGDQ